MFNLSLLLTMLLNGGGSAAIYTMLLAFVITVILCPIVIPILHRMKFGQPIRNEGPQSHKKKVHQLWVVL